MRAVSAFGREPPERATVNRPCLSMASFWALRMYSARESERVEGSGKEYRIGGVGGCMTKRDKVVSE
jgi:hypothetical protein